MIIALLIANVVFSLAHFVWKRVGLKLRAEHRLTCRVYYQALAIFDAGLMVTAVAFWWLVAVRWFAWVIIGLGVFAEGSDVFLWSRGALHPAKEPWESPWGRVMWPGHWTTTEHACEAWRHRKHDDDCEHGPVRRWTGATARLQSWRKVALNPAFTPS